MVWWEYYYDEVTRRLLLKLHEWTLLQNLNRVNVYLKNRGPLSNVSEK
jgi:hypothetical protein